MKSIVEKIHKEFKTSSEELFCKQNSREQLLSVGLDKQVRMMDLQKKYPTHKVIQKTRVQQICEKYKLHFDELENYIGGIPNKNLQEIIDFKNKHLIHHYNEYSGLFGFKIKQITCRGLNGVPDKQKEFAKNMSGSFFICAPLKDFDRASISRSANDPIILWCESSWIRSSEPLVIVTAWGDEAKDEQVFNEKLN